jgi:phosphate transport system permease protein
VRGLEARRGRTGERAFHLLCLLAVLIPLAMLGVLLFDVIRDGVGRLSWEFIRSFPSSRAIRAGLWPALVGSLWIIGLTALLAVPIGVAAAVFLEEYGKGSKIAALIEINIANLAGVPSIIYGLLGLELFVRLFGMGRTILAAACTLTLLVLPVVIMSSREALRTITGGLREGGLALGATRWQTIRHIVLPMAVPGIMTGSILAISRAIGETAPLVVVGAAVFISFTPDGPRSEYTSLPIQIFNWASMPQQAFLANAAAGIIVLMVTLLLLNSVAIVVRERFQTRS